MYSRPLQPNIVRRTQVTAIGQIRAPGRPSTTPFLVGSLPLSLSPQHADRILSTTQHAHLSLQVGPILLGLLKILGWLTTTTTAADLIQPLPARPRAIQPMSSRRPTQKTYKQASSLPRRTMSDWS